MQPRKLPWDMIAQVLLYCDQQTVLKVMKTCRRLADEGAKCILAAPTVNVGLWNAKALKSFVRFMRLDGTKRGHLLHSLSLHVPSNSRQAVRLRKFFAKLASFSGLKELYVADLESFFQADPRLIHALGELKSIQSLEIDYAADNCLHFFDVTQSHLTYIDVRFPPTLQDRFNLCIAKLFDRFKNSLEHLDIAYPGEPSSPSAELTYPCLQTLILKQPARVPDLLDYLIPFPNLSSFSYEWEANRLSEDADWEARRVNNTTYQWAKGTWANPMVELRGELQVLYSFALPVHVQKLRIDGRDLHGSNVVQETARMLRAVLEGVRPAELHYEVGCCAVFEDAAFVAALLERREPSIRVLKLVLTVNPALDLDVHFFLMMETLRRIATALRVVEFSLEFDRSDVRDLLHMAALDYGLNPRNIRRYNLRNFARILKASCPSLKRANVNLNRVKDLSKLKWREERK